MVVRRLIAALLATAMTVEGFVLPRTAHHTHHTLLRATKDNDPERQRTLDEAKRILARAANTPVDVDQGLGGAVTGKGRVVPALQSATALEVRAGLQAASMLESGFGGVTALLGDLQASSVAVDSVSRCTLLAAALLEL